MNPAEKPQPVPEKAKNLFPDWLLRYAIEAEARFGKPTHPEPYPEADLTELNAFNEASDPDSEADAGLQSQSETENEEQR